MSKWHDKEGVARSDEPNYCQNHHQLFLASQGFTIMIDYECYLY